MIGLRFSLILLQPLAVIIGLILGGNYCFLPLLPYLFVYLFLDNILPEDVTFSAKTHSLLGDTILCLVLPLNIIGFLLVIWALGAGGTDFLKIGAVVQAASGHDLFAARLHTSALQIFSMIIVAATTAFGGAGTIAAHELVHRTASKRLVIVGRWLLAFTFNADFAIEHVYGHHKNVCTAKDPATALRGETVYGFIPRSIFGQFIGAWHIEQSRLTRRGVPIWSRFNKMLVGIAMSLGLLALGLVGAGIKGLLVTIFMMALGRIMLEMINFIEHYGLVRASGTRVEPRHSWDTLNLFSNSGMLGLGRHAAHHERANLPFWQLEPQAGAPRLPFGLGLSQLCTLVPPLWDALIVPRLRLWDQQANPVERALAIKFNAQSKRAAYRNLV